MIMGRSQYDPDAQERRAWNAGRKVGAKRALKPRQVWAVRFFLDQHRRVRDRALFDLATVQILLGHTKIENTVRYLGVDVEDALTLAEGTEI
jgi:hypothetical protein